MQRCVYMRDVKLQLNKKCARDLYFLVHAHGILSSRIPGYLGGTVECTCNAIIKRLC